MVHLNRRQKKQLRPQSRQPFRGGERPSVFSYRASRIEQERQFDRTGSAFAERSASTLRKLRRLPVVLSSLVILATLAYTTMLSSNAQLIVNGDQILLRGREAYELSINTALQSSIWNRSKLTVDRSKLVEQLKQSFPEIETVRISTGVLRHRPVVEVTLAKPAVMLATQSKTYILDGRGRALFDERSKSSLLHTDSLPVVTDETGHTIEIGKPALTQEQVLYIRQLFLQAAEKKRTISTMMLQPGGRELLVVFDTATYPVKFSFEADPRQSIGAYFAVQDRLRQEGKTPAEYIDARIPDRVFVK